MFPESAGLEPPGYTLLSRSPNILPPGGHQWLRLFAPRHYRRFETSLFFPVLFQERADLAEFFLGGSAIYHLEVRMLKCFKVYLYHVRSLENIALSSKTQTETSNERIARYSFTRYWLCSRDF
jgi:hypothetical protein